MLRVLHRTFIILSMALTFYLFFYFMERPWKTTANLNMKVSLSAPTENRHPRMDTIDSRNQALPSTSLPMGTESTTFSSPYNATECTYNYILSVWDQKGHSSALGNKMADYASLIGHARRLKLRPFILPTIKEVLSKVFW